MKNGRFCTHPRAIIVIEVRGGVFSPMHVIDVRPNEGF